MNNSDESPKKRIQFARQSARNLLARFFAHDPPRRIPVPIENIAVFLGFEIHPLDTLDGEHRGIKIEIPEEGRRLIGVNKHYHRNNQRFSIAHEIGHHVMGHPPEDDCSEEEAKTYNREADEFAGEILIPLEELKEILKEIKDVKGAAVRFQVSEQAMWIKVQNQNLLSFLG